MRTTKPLFVRPLTPTERTVLEDSVRSSDAFVLRRAQIVLASAAGERSGQIAARVGRTTQAVRDVVHAFHVQGLAILQRSVPRPPTVCASFDVAGAEALRALWPQSPRLFGKASSLWTLDLAAAGAYAQGLTARQVRRETIRRTLRRLEVRWRRAKHCITSPDPEYARKKARRDRLIRLAQQHPAWLLGFEDEVWGRRLARPAVHAWQQEDHPLRLVEQTVAPDAVAPKALACYGLLARCWDTAGARTEEMWRRFVEGRPVSAVTSDFVACCAQQAQAQGKRVLLLVWDNASWHDSQKVRTWLRAHNRQVKQTGQGVRLLPCLLPSKSPWRNPIEPKWLSGKEKIVEPTRTLIATALAERVCAVYGCAHEPHLITPPAPPRPALIALPSAEKKAPQRTTKKVA
jgi:hypothetical protein